MVSNFETGMRKIKRKRSSSQLSSSGIKNNGMQSVWPSYNIFWSAWTPAGQPARVQNKEVHNDSPISNARRLGQELGQQGNHGYPTVRPIGSTSLLCDKLNVYGFDQWSCGWFRLFLLGRKQSVKIGKTVSRPKGLESGDPQGGILSPIIFTIYVADLGEWIKKSTIFTYADDTSSSCSGRSMEEVKEKVEEDEEAILE